jgi:hypothetical protein
LGQLYSFFSVAEPLLVLFLSLFCSLTLSALLLTSLPLNTLRLFQLKLAEASCLIDLGLLGFLKLFKLGLLLL